MGYGSRTKFAFLAFALFCASAFTSAAQSDTAQLPASANDLVRAVVQNELKQAEDTLKLYAFKQRTEKPRGTQIKQMVETPDGILGRVITVNDKPLSPEERRKDDARINRLLDPNEMRKKAKEQKEDERRTREMVRALPDAFVYEYNGTQPGPNGSEVVRLRFRPNPKFDPPTRETLVFQGMEGEMWIDPKIRRMAKIDGTMIKDVTIGWGILGRLDRGGRFIVEQGEVVPGRWETTKLSLDFNGKALLFKTIRIKSTDTFSDFRLVPPMNVAQALDFLRKSEQQVQNASK